MASSRLPDKPLADLAGLPMVVRVAQRAKLSGASRVVVAADDDRILVACQAHSIEAVLTRTDHPSGSDRLAEACDLLGLQDSDVVVNVQGDEPLIDPASIDAAAKLLHTRSDCSMSTLAHAIDNVADFTNPNVVKVVLDSRQTALYFSRAPIAWWRDGGITTLPHPASIMPGRQARVISAALVKFTSNARVQSAGLWSTKARGTEGAPIDPMPALFTSTSIGPSQASSSAETATGSVKSVT